MSQEKPSDDVLPSFTRDLERAQGLPRYPTVPFPVAVFRVVRTFGRVLRLRLARRLGA